MDIVVFGILLAFLTSMTERRREITRQMELIDDFKKWDSDEARHRIAGAIRRLNKLNRTAIDFSGIEISNFRFRWLEIRSIAGSTFYDGSWGTWSGKDQVTLTEVDFANVDCRDVIFPNSTPCPVSTCRLVSPRSRIATSWMPSCKALFFEAHTSSGRKSRRKKWANGRIWEMEMELASRPTTRHSMGQT